MSDKDVVIQSSLRVPDGSIAPIKPCYLVALSPTKTVKKMFIALDLPAMETSHIKCKGIFVDATEEVVIENYIELIKTLTTDKKNIVEIYFPWIKVEYIRSLVYNANKSK